MEPFLVEQSEINREIAMNYRAMELLVPVDALTGTYAIDRV